jgi:agmatine deiminase
MPPEWAPHERTVMGWPTRTRVESLWHDQLDAARSAHAVVARTVARFEPVTVVADPDDLDDASRRCGDEVEVVGLPVDDSWLRDSGPVVVRAPDGSRHAVHFGFNAWGDAFRPWDRDAEVGGLVADRLGIGVHDATDFVLEGGSIAVDGQGILATTERCLLNPNRNPDLDRDEVEERLRQWLGATEVVWLRDGIAEDEGTDGHVDNVVAFVGAARAVLQGCDLPDNPNHANAADGRGRLEAAGVDVVELASLPYATVAGVTVPVPYGNFYVCNGAVVVPTVEGGESKWLDVIGECFGDREVVPVPGEVLAYGGGGVHCITQQIPAADR